MSELRLNPFAKMRFADRVAARLAGSSQGRAVRRVALCPAPVGDAVRGRDLASGTIGFIPSAPIWLGTGGSLWTVDSPSPAFEAARQGFGWLDDLAALGTAGARHTAQAWVAHWLDRQGRGAGPGWTIDLVACRLWQIAVHGDWLTQGADGVPRARIERAAARHLLFARWRTGAVPAGLVGIETAARLLACAVGLDGGTTVSARAQDELDRRARLLAEAVGSVPDRAPETLARLFCALAFAASALEDAGLPVSQAHRRAMDSAAPLLRALRHGDGGLARFNGGGAGDRARLDAAFAAAGLRAAPAPLPGRPMGYVRLTRGRVSLIADAAPPPHAAAPATAHAGTLAFELTIGRHPMVVSCGPGDGFGADLRRAARASAAHSTLTVDGTSSAGFAAVSDGAPMSGAPDDVQSDLTLAGEVAQLAAAHNGYAASHGLIHVRRLDLSVDGGLLRGEDILTAVTEVEKRRFAELRNRAPAGGVPFAVRFHLHPACGADLDAEREAVWLRLPNGEAWMFRHASACTIRLDQSVYLEKTRPEPVATRQIVLDGLAMHEATAIRWTFARDADVPAFRRDATSAPSDTEKDAADWRAEWQEQDRHEDT